MLPKRPPSILESVSAEVVPAVEKWYWDTCEIIECGIPPPRSEILLGEREKRKGGREKERERERKRRGEREKKKGRERRKGERKGEKKQFNQKTFPQHFLMNQEATPSDRKENHERSVRESRESKCVTFEHWF